MGQISIAFSINFGQIFLKNSFGTEFLTCQSTKKYGPHDASRFWNLTICSTAHDYFRKVAGELTSWKHFKKLMNDQYEYLDDVNSATNQLLRFAQRPKETIPQYLERLRLLARSAYHNQLDQPAVTHTITQTFIHGLTDKHLQRHVARRKPKDVDAAFRIAMDENRLTREYGIPANSSKSTPEAMDCDAMTPSQASQELSEVKELLKILARRSEPFQVQPQQAPQANFSSPPPRMTNTSPRYPPRAMPPQNQVPNGVQKYQWTPDRKPICAFCGIIGHVHRVCRKKAAANGMRPPPQGQGMERRGDRNYQPGNR